jgi:DNA-binding transcriptional MerR regulator
MNQFSIKDIENLCGVKAHTLRVWEQRYNLFTPKRKESQHRIYDCDDLKELLQISFLYHNGYKISRIAELSPDEIAAEVAKIRPQGCNYETYVHQLIEASVSFDQEAFQKIVNGLVLRMGLENAMVSVFYPFLQRIGLLWMTNHVIPAQEHFCSHIIRKKIICATDGLELSKQGNLNVVIFSPVGELHEIPLLLVNYLLRKRGVWTTYFGCNVDNAALAYYQSNVPVTHFVSHLVTQLASESLGTSIRELCHQYPSIPVHVSGPAACCICDSPGNLHRFSSLAEVTQFAEDIISASHNS